MFSYTDKMAVKEEVLSKLWCSYRKNFKAISTFSVPLVSLLLL